MITGTKWKVMPCPVHGGKHPYHDGRWIVTDDAEVEHGRVPGEWRLEKGSLIAMMMDVHSDNGRLIAAAPELMRRTIALRAYCEKVRNSDSWYVREAIRRTDFSEVDNLIRSVTI